MDRAGPGRLWTSTIRFISRTYMWWWYYWYTRPIFFCSVLSYFVTLFYNVWPQTRREIGRGENWYSSVQTLWWPKRINDVDILTPLMGTRQNVDAFNCTTRDSRQRRIDQVYNVWCFYTLNRGAQKLRLGGYWIFWQFVMFLPTIPNLFVLVSFFFETTIYYTCTTISFYTNIWN